MLQGEHSVILLTFIKLPFVIKIFVLSIFEWPFYTGFTVQSFNHSTADSFLVILTDHLVMTTAPDKQTTLLLPVTKFQGFHTPLGMGPGSMELGKFAAF